MNENINLTKILKNCPKGWKLWSPIFGVVKFEIILESRGVVIVDVGNRELWTFNSDATFPIGNIKSIEIMLYPSRENRDWSKFTAPWCNPEKQGEQKKQVHSLFTFDNAFALQCCMETVKKVQEANKQYEKLNLIHSKMYDAYGFEKQGKQVSSQTNIGKNKQKFDPKSLQPFDKVLVKNDYNPTSIWYADFVSYRRDIDEIPVTMYDCMTPMVIPYNEETKHLCGTSNEAPEYYRYWEDNEEAIPKMSIK